MTTAPLSAENRSPLPRSILQLWALGAEVIPFSLVASFFTCIGSTGANAMYSLGSESVPAILGRIGIGYAGAVLMVVTALPWLHVARLYLRLRRSHDHLA